MQVCLTAAVWVLATLTAAAQHIPLGLDAYRPAPADNPLTAESIEAGRRLFFDRRLSRDESMSCASCHDPAAAFTDGRPTAIGVNGRIGPRNSPTLINLAYGTRLFWDGRLLTLEQQVIMPIANPLEMDLDVATAARRVGLSSSALARALASYVRSILSANSRFDQFTAGERNALTPVEQAGLELFRGKARCTTCHVGPTLSDDRVHNTGIAWRDGGLQDPGAGSGRFKTPTLREITRTAPYMHDGSLATIDEVIDYYDRGGNRHDLLDREVKPLALSAGEKAQLKSFLQSLGANAPASPDAVIAHRAANP